MNDLEKRLSILKSDLTTTWQKLQITKKIAKLEDLERQISEPELWQNPENAKKVNTSFSRLKSEVEPWQMLEMQTSDLQEILELQEPDLISEINDQLTSMEQTLAGLKKALRFTNQYDEKNAIIRITAGVGGTEAMDWAGMLERMYLRFFEKNNYSVELIERTSFSLVEILPILDSEDDLKIDEKDLRIDTYHAGGHGGQSVNTTNSAIRITHLPTNTVVAIQNERSQLQNREKAMEILRGKLIQMQQEQQAESINQLRAGESAKWGQQIRNYVLQPYKLVKDTRTKYEETDADAVLNGKIDGFIDAYLESQIGEN